MTHLESNQFSLELQDALARVSQGKERIVLQSEGKDVAVLVPLDDLPLIEELEDRLDIEAAEAAEAEAEARGEAPVPWEDACKQLGQ